MVVFLILPPQKKEVSTVHLATTLGRTIPIASQLALILPPKLGWANLELLAMLGKLQVLRARKGGRYFFLKKTH